LEQNSPLIEVSCQRAGGHMTGLGNTVIWCVSAQHAVTQYPVDYIWPATNLSQMMGMCVYATRYTEYTQVKPFWHMCRNSGLRKQESDLVPTVIFGINFYSSLGIFCQLSKIEQSQ